jgi:4,5-dihydroxyphthalate decarboxylase
MSSALALKIACDPFEFVRALREGAVSADGIDLIFQPEMSNPKRHRAMVGDLAFDVCELNIGSYLIAKDLGVPITAIPVFLFRKFRHGNVFVRSDSSIASPKDLVGKRVGCPTLQPASNIWIHGILQDNYGLPHRSIRWVAEREEDLPFVAPVDLDIVRLSAGKNVIDLLLSGEVEAVTCPQTPELVVAGDDRITRLFPDYVDRERKYFRDTEIFPIMHVTAIPQRLIDQEPWIVRSLMAAFEESKQKALKHFANTRLSTLAWFSAMWEEERLLLGKDPWEYGLSPRNQKNIETVIRYSHEQGLIRRRPELDELFVAE